MRTFVRENSLSLFSGLIFVISLVGQSLVGWHQFNATQTAEHFDAIRWST
ncbi:DUF6766 family protein [Nocardioides astragali]|uniref:DUF6766 family protein n=1 Tax=Nocardioides astragali TaxID=1776736 RepID=A0ABW2N4A1_9ACTN|nr:DUF6766 family protein [Nocardioides astragali]